jgi:hypothetical protein
MNSVVVMVLLMPAAALLLFSLVRMLVFRRFSMRVILAFVTGATVLIPSLLSIR